MTRRKTLGFIVVATGILLANGACGSSDEDSGGSGATGGSAGASTGGSGGSSGAGKGGSANSGGSTGKGGSLGSGGTLTALRTRPATSIARTARWTASAPLAPGTAAAEIVRSIATRWATALISAAAEIARSIAITARTATSAAATVAATSCVTRGVRALSPVRRERPAT
jgi:hypothetical protein